MSKFIPKKPRKNTGPIQWIVKPRRTKVLSFTDRLFDYVDRVRSSFSLRRHGLALGVAVIFAGGIAIGVGIGTRHSAPIPAPIPAFVAQHPTDSLPSLTPPQIPHERPGDLPIAQDEAELESFSATPDSENPDQSSLEEFSGPVVAIPPSPKSGDLPAHQVAVEAIPQVKVDTKPAAHRHPELASLPLPPEPQLEGMPQWRRNAVAAPKMDGRPRIALVIDDLGVDRHRSAAVIDLPGPLTTAFLSYASDLPAQTRAAHAAGHELIIHVPMEPKNPDMDPGPDALLVSRNEAQIRHGLEGIFNRFPGYVGINNHMGSLFTGNVRGMSVVLGELKKRGLLFLDSRTSSDSVGPEIARRFGLPFAVRDVFIDNENDLVHVRARLAEMEKIARHRGWVVGIGHPRDATLEALRAWLPTLQRKGFVLVPVSSIVRQRMEAVHVSQ